MLRATALLLAGMLLATLPSALSAQTATFAGTVVIDGTSKPLPGAEVGIAALGLTVRSDKAGNFTLTGIPAGKHEIVVRLVGYDPFGAELTFAAGQRVEADVTLTPSSTKLAKVDVRDTLRTVNPRLVEFEERRQSPGGGRFITSDVFEKMSGSRITDILLGRIPGIKRVNLSTSSVRPLATTRGGQSRALMAGAGTTNCFVQIALNGAVVYNMDIAKGDYYDIDRLNTAEVIGVEFYTVANTPTRYAGTGANCGTVIIWTK